MMEISVTVSNKLKLDPIDRAIRDIENALNWLRETRHPLDIPLACYRLRAALKILEK
jgi:hypothetical protein